MAVTLIITAIIFIDNRKIKCYNVYVKIYHLEKDFVTRIFLMIDGWKQYLYIYDLRKAWRRR